MTPDLAHELFEYADGVLLRRKRRGPALAGTVVGSRCTDGRLQVKVGRKMHYVHRIIYMMHTGESPEMVDHINGDVSDNRIENLRAATRSQNNANARLRRDNTSGVKGVGRHRGKWRARITVGTQQIHLGYFDTKRDAENCVRDARQKHHGAFMRHA